VLGFVSQEANGQWRLEIQPDYDQPLQFVADVGPCQATTRSSTDPDWFFPGPADDLQNEKSPEWTVRTGFWATEGVSAINSRTGEWRPIMSVEMPWMAWFPRNATVLPNDQFIFQLGEQIIWVDLSRNLAAGLAAGHGPVAVLDNGSTTQSSTLTIQN
jgi:hypothetical protein